MEFIEKIKRYIYRKFVSYYNIDPSKKVIYNLNIDICKEQKRLAFVYLNSLYDRPYTNQVYHVNRIHIYQLLLPFINMGYIIDIYPAEHLNNDDISDIKYDVIFGFGPTYMKLITNNPNALKILFITENAPWIVREKFAERLDWYKERTGKLPQYAISRTNFYVDEMFSLSDYGICINGTKNISSMQSKLRPIYQLNINALYGKHKEINKDHKRTRRKFLWFGSTGAIHKGLDLLVEVFKRLPEYQLDVYGAGLLELKDMEFPSNIVICNKINVLSDRFIDEVVNEHSYVISLSCSEGMQSGIATCMMYGIIPIVSIETGFDDNPYAIIPESLDIDHIISIIKECASKTSEELLKLEQDVMRFASSHYTIEEFTETYNQIISKIFQYDF